MKKIAIIGFGIMGAGMADNFLKKGHKVFVWNRTKEKLSPLVKKGAVECATPKAAAEQAEIVIEITANDSSSKEVWLGENGILEGAKKDSYLIASSTLSIAWTDELAKTVAAAGFKFFDIPLTGSRAGAETGTLFMMAGGNENELKKIEKDLKSVAAQIVCFGKVGNGMRFKLLLQALQSVHLLAFGEMMKVAADLGLEAKPVGETFCERPGGGVTKMGWNNLQKPPTQVNFALEWMIKDLRYAKQMTGDIETPFLDDALKKLEAAEKKIGAKADWTGSIK